ARLSALHAAGRNRGRNLERAAEGAGRAAFGQSRRDSAVAETGSAREDAGETPGPAGARRARRGRTETAARTESAARIDWRTWRRVFRPDSQMGGFEARPDGQQGAGQWAR